MVQLYLRPLYPGPQDAQQQLRAINTAYLLPGQATKLQFNVQAAQDFAVYDPAQRRFVVKPGDYEIQLGASSADIRLRQKSTFSRNYHCGFIELGAVGAEFYKKPRIPSGFCSFTTRHYSGAFEKVQPRIN